MKALKAVANLRFSEAASAQLKQRVQLLAFDPAETTAFRLLVGTDCQLVTVLQDGTDFMTLAMNAQRRASIWDDQRKTYLDLSSPFP